MSNENMKYWCDCFKRCPEEAGFNTVIETVVDMEIQIDSSGKPIGPGFVDMLVDIPNRFEIHEVTCGCCGEVIS